MSGEQRKMKIMLRALRRIPIIRVSKDSLGWECVGCGAVSGVHPDGSSREESCKPNCYVPIVERAIGVGES